MLLMKNVLSVILLIAGFCLSQALFAQSKKGEVKGLILEPVNKKPLPYATVAVYNAQDTTLITFRVSDDKGTFRATGLPVNAALRLVISMTGYNIFRRELTLTPAQSVADLGTITLTESNMQLKEVVITAEIPPIVVRKDTLEFNAASFKTLPSALVEDLLKKLPGVSVDKDGNISVNGKSVNKILVDGKEFFGGDPKVATRNLPADMIEKVQVTNDPEALRRNPDLPAIEIPQVVNLKLKRSIKKGVFGKLYAGTGANSRYEGGGILNMFRDTTQISILGYSNNLNRPGFGYEDISRIGGFNRSGFNSMSVHSDGGFALNDISFGATGAGIQQSTGGGANFNTLLPHKLTLNLQYFFGNINSRLNQVNNSNQLLDTVTLNSRNNLSQTSETYSHRFGSKLEGKLDSLTFFSISPSLAVNTSDSRHTNVTETLKNLADLLNNSNNNQNQTDGSLNFNTTVSLEREFRKKGRSLHYFGNIRFGTSAGDQYYNVLNTFYEPDYATTLLDQLRETESKTRLISNSLRYTEPISKKLSTVFHFVSDYFKDDNTIQTYNRNESTSQYQDLEPLLSNELTRQGWRNNLNSSLRWKIGEVTFQPGVRLSSINIINSFQNQPNLEQKFFFINPSLNVNWKALHLGYNTDIQEPNTMDLQPIINNTNPLFIIRGNPGLKPTLSNSINLYYNLYDPKRLLNVSAYSYGTIQKNAIVRERTLSPDGVQTTRPVNSDGVWYIDGHLGVTKDFKFNTKNQFSIGPSVRVSYNKNLILLNNQKSDVKIWGLRPGLEARMNLDDKLELTQSFSNDNQRSYYTANTFDNRKVNYRTWRSEIVVRVIKKLVLESALEYRYTSDAAPGLQQSYNRVNAAVTYLFLKNDRAQLKFSVYDLLNQNISTYRTIHENIIADYQTTVLNRYGLLTFTYNIRNFGGKVGGSSPLFRF